MNRKVQHGTTSEKANFLLHYQFLFVSIKGIFKEKKTENDASVKGWLGFLKRAIMTPLVQSSFFQTSKYLIDTYGATFVSSKSQAAFWHDTENMFSLFFHPSKNWFGRELQLLVA